MKTSVSVFLTDILPDRRRVFHRFVKSEYFDGKSNDEVFAILKKAGIAGIELVLPVYVTYRDIEKVKRILDEQAMPVFSIHQPLRFLTRTRMAEITKLFHIADRLGAKIIVLHLSSTGRQIFDNDYIQTLHSLQEKYKIAIGFENRDKQIFDLFNAYSWDENEFPKLLEKSGFRMTLDTTHLAHAGGNIVEFFKNNKKQIINIHLSDYKHHVLNSTLRPLRYRHMALGKGTLPISDFLKLLKKEHYDGLVTMEINSDLEGVCVSAEMIRETSEGKI